MVTWATTTIGCNICVQKVSDWQNPLWMCQSYVLAIAGMTNVAGQSYVLAIAGMTNVAGQSYVLAIAGMTNVAGQSYVLAIAGMTNVAGQTADGQNIKWNYIKCFTCFFFISKYPNV